eukprot:CFRG5483T1
MDDKEIPSAQVSETPVCVFRKRTTTKTKQQATSQRKGKSRNARKKETLTSSSESGSSDDGNGGSNVVRVQRKRRKLNVSGTTVRNRARNSNRTSLNNESNSFESEESDSDGMLDMAKASRVENSRGDTGAASINTIDGPDEQALSAGDVRSDSVQTTGGVKVSSFLKPGPQKASANIRVTSRFDYQPDVCKDYKETGYCGFGDTCKFLHDRGDYKTGWQLEREWDSGNYGKQNQESDSDSEDDEVPFACYICREEFTNPVMTRCNHYFCMKCALDHYKTSKTCYVCGSPTNGVFNTAKKVLEKLKRKQAAVQAKEHE